MIYNRFGANARFSFVVGKFWEKQSLAQMSEAQWESLCDGCGWCCLVKLEDEDSGEIVYTRAACELLDVTSCRCSDYANRFQKVHGCVKVGLDNLAELLDKQNWLPETCAYRLLYEGKPLPSWHPLISGKASSVIDKGVSVSLFAVSETVVHPAQFIEMIIEDE